MNENRLICRGKREDTGKWVEGYYVRLDGIDSPLHIIIDRAGQYNRVLPETVGECTGCLDSMGRLIFEGDILSRNGTDYQYVVDWNEENHGFRLNAPSLWEIVGNVNEVSDEEQEPTEAATEEAEAGVQENPEREKV